MIRRFIRWIALRTRDFWVEQDQRTKAAVCEDILPPQHVIGSTMGLRKGNVVVCLLVADNARILELTTYCEAAASRQFGNTHVEPKTQLHVMQEGETIAQVIERALVVQFLEK